MTEITHKLNVKRVPKGSQRIILVDMGDLRFVTN